MPIRPENKDLYPDDWKEISAFIRHERAGDRCEFPVDDGTRCTALNGQPHPVTGSKVVLTVAHLDHDPSNSGENYDNLLAGCQRCHNRYDAPHRAETRRRNSPQGDLFLQPDKGRDHKSE